MRYAYNMKSYQWILFSIVMLSCAACRRDKAVEVVEPATPPPAAVAKADIPTDADRENFLLRYSESPGEETVFHVTFDTARLIPPVMNEFRERGKIPFAISVDFATRKPDPFDPRFVNHFSIMEGQAEIAVLDADGRVVDRTRKDLALLCPS